MDLNKLWVKYPYNDELMVSCDGDICSLQFTVDTKTGPQIFKQRNRKLYLSNSGYLAFRFRGEHFLLHRVIAHTFVSGYSEERCHVNHIDCNKLNNSISNLEWVTPEYNVQHAFNNGCHDGVRNYSKGENRYNCKLTEEDVIFIRKSSEKLESLSEMFNVSKALISKVRRKEVWKHVG